LLLIPFLDMFQATAPPVPPHTPKASDPPAPPHNPPQDSAPPAPPGTPPSAAASDIAASTTISTDPAPAAVQSETTSPAGVSFSLPDQHDGEKIRDSPKRESHRRKSEENKMNTRAVLDRHAKSKRQDRLDKMRKKAESAENAERMLAAEQKMREEQEMRTRQHEKEMIALDDLILEAQMDLGIEDID